MSRQALIAAGLAFALAVGAANSKTVSHAGACPSVSILGDATRVTGVDTDAGRIDADYVVLCPGMWGRDLAASVGVNLPLHACEHYYVMFEAIPGLAPQLPVLREHVADWFELDGDSPYMLLVADVQASKLLPLDGQLRKRIMGDESLKDAGAAVAFAHDPKPFGIYNIKLMKCGGIAGAMEIATIARAAGIDLFWGCNDESILSITAALHAAYSCPHTRYIDLDGSFDLAEDLVTGGFTVEQGYLKINNEPGFGTRMV